MYKKQFFSAAILFVTFTAFAQQKYEIGNPNDKANYGYLNEYAPLKEYIDYEKYPNFKLGIGTTVSNYLNNATVRGLTNDNFTETVAGNAMKMSSCVNSNGSMNFTQVKNYVNAATQAGLAVYGHTLAWHSQQPVAWLNSLIKDVPAEPFENPDTLVYVEVKSKDFCTQQSVGWTADKTAYGFTIDFSSTNGLHVKTTKKNNSWEVQFVAVDGIPMEKGKTYKVTITTKGSSKGNLYTKLGDWSSGVNVNTTFATEWKDIELTYKNATAGSFLLLQCGDFVGDLYIKGIKVEEAVGAMKVNEAKRYIRVEASARTSEVWDNQFWIVSPTTLNKGASFVFSADVRADKSAKASTQLHNSPGSYVTYQALGDIQFTTEWKTVQVSGTLADAGKSIAFNLSELADANVYYFDNISFKIGGVEKMKNGSFDGTDLSTFKMKKAGGGIVAPVIEETEFYLQLPESTPLTAQEKHDTLVWAMDKWIRGMMEACNGKVKSWDVVNEAISGGGDDGSGNYTLQHDNGSGDFFWQDHMGDLEYVRSAIRLARKYGPEDIKLFINDYNLESDWDSNKKLKSLINWIKKWEADSETVVDGIGTQMHISYYANASTQKSKENAIVNMFKLMAGTGKLVRVSELDMGYNDANGNSVSTANMTEEMHHKMADHYEWIVKKYLEIVPPAQQAGICFWCPTDSPTNSGWRADTPVGIWTLDYYRKHAYASIAEGLGGVNMTGIHGVASDEVSIDNAHKANGIFTIMGVRMPDHVKLSDLPAGIYIVNGKKVVR